MTTNTTAALDLDRLEALARAATRGPWKRAERLSGPFWHISSEHTIGGEPCKSGRQAIASVHGESKRGATAYAAMFEANADFIAAANPAAILALIEAARRSQPIASSGAAGAGSEQRALSQLAFEEIAASWDGCNYSDAMIPDIGAALRADFERLAATSTSASAAGSEQDELRAKLAEMTAKYRAELGKRLIAEVVQEQDERASVNGKQNQQNFREACEHRGITPSQDLFNLWQDARAALAHGASSAPLSGEEMLDIAAPYFAWNADSWRTATQGTIGMPALLNYTRAVNDAAIARHSASSAPADLSHRLRETADQQPGWKSLLTAAADEIDRYYSGMLAWKQTAEKKDRDWKAERMGRVNERCAARAAVSGQADELHIGMSNNDQGVHVNIIQRHADRTSTVIFTAKVPPGDSHARAALAQRASSAPADDKHLPGWERGIATVTLDGHQLRAALGIVNPDGEADPDQLDDWLTFGIVQHRDDDGNESTGMCCWNDDSEGVMPLDGTAGHDATPASAQPADTAPAADAAQLLLALRKYGTHLHTCECVDGGEVDASLEEYCDCGLNAILVDEHAKELIDQHQTGYRHGLDSDAGGAQPAHRLEQQLIERRIAITPENEGGFHALIYGDSDVVQQRGYGATPSEAVAAAQAVAPSAQPVAAAPAEQFSLVGQSIAVGNERIIIARAITVEWAYRIAAALTAPATSVAQATPASAGESDLYAAALLAVERMRGCAATYIEDHAKDTYYGYVGVRPQDVATMWAKEIHGIDAKAYLDEAIDDLKADRTTALPSGASAGADARDEFSRGYYCATAVLLREWGDANTDVRSLFSQGGDPSKADQCDQELFREHGLMPVAAQGGAK